MLTPELERWRNAVAAVIGAEEAAGLFAAPMKKFAADPERLRKVCRSIVGNIAPDALADVEPEPESEPEPPKASEPVEAVEQQRRPLPATLPDPGLTAVTDSGLPGYVGHQATAVWLCLLRHANGRRGRVVQRISYGTLGDGTGLSRQQVRVGLRVLLGHGIVKRLRTGRLENGEHRTTVYHVPAPTPDMVRRWRLAAALLADESAEGHDTPGD